MKMIRLFFLVICPALLLVSCAVLHAGKKSAKPRVLVFSKTAGYHHASISYGIAAIPKLGAANGFEVDTHAGASWLHEEIGRASCRERVSQTGSLPEGRGSFKKKKQ